MKTCRECAYREASGPAGWCRIRNERAARKRKACHLFAPSVAAMRKRNGKTGFENGKK